MVRCVNCSQFHRKTRKCEYYSKKLNRDVIMPVSEIHKQIPCKGYKPKHMWKVGPRRKNGRFLKVKG